MVETFVVYGAFGNPGGGIPLERSDEIVSYGGRPIQPPLVECSSHISPYSPVLSADVDPVDPVDSVAVRTEALPGPLTANRARRRTGPEPNPEPLGTKQASNERLKKRSTERSTERSNKRSNERSNERSISTGTL